MRVFFGERFWSLERLLGCLVSGVLANQLVSGIDGHRDGGTWAGHHSWCFRLLLVLILVTCLLMSVRPIVILVVLMASVVTPIVLLLGVWLSIGLLVAWSSTASRVLLITSVITLLRLIVLRRELLLLLLFILEVAFHLLLLQLRLEFLQVINVFHHDRTDILCKT